METAIVRAVILLSVFSAFFLAAQVVLGALWRQRQKHAAINTRLRMIKEGGDREQIGCSSTVIIVPSSRNG